MKLSALIARLVDIHEIYGDSMPIFIAIHEDKNGFKKYPLEGFHCGQDDRTKQNFMFLCEPQAYDSMLENKREDWIEL